jgi:tetratricopeptide (TPR) repeat protein
VRSKICSGFPAVKGSPSGTASPKPIIFRTIEPGALIFCATLLAYLPALSGDFIWNDSDFVTAPALRSLDGLVRIWTEPGATQQYYPLLHGAFWVQHRFFGDHWQYLPDLGPLALAAAGLVAGWRRAALRLHWLGAGLVAALAVLLGALTWSHRGMYHDDQTLYLTTLARNPGCWMARNNMGDVLSKMPGRLNDAAAQYEEALRLKPDFAPGWHNLGVSWLRLRNMPAAAAAFREEVRLTPDDPAARQALAAAGGTN